MSLRYPDECVRHKILDMVGDLALLGFDLHGFVVAHRSGHQTNHALSRRLLEQAGEVDRLPGARSVACGENGVIDITGIMSLLPHRYPFLLVDRVLELDPGHRAVAIKNVSVNEPFFRGHWPGQPIMPGVLIVEALAQAAGVLICRQRRPLRPGRVALIASLDGVKLRRPVVPGDQLRLEVIGQKDKIQRGLRLRRGQGGGCRGRGGQAPVGDGERRPCRRVLGSRRSAAAAAMSKAG